MIISFLDPGVDAVDNNISLEGDQLVVLVNVKAGFVLPKSTFNIGDDHVLNRKADLGMVRIYCILTCQDRR